MKPKRKSRARGEVIEVTQVARALADQWLDDQRRRNAAIRRGDDAAKYESRECMAAIRAVTVALGSAVREEFARMLMPKPSRPYGAEAAVTDMESKR